jgi:general secretion pathway protein D
LGAIARALETDDNTNILSMPNLITLDNEEARIIVGQNVPFVTGQFTTAASGGAAGVNPFQTIERKDIGLSLRVRPQISEGGTVKMAIYQETSAIQRDTASGLITTKRALDTNVLVDDGQIIVLGGLIDDTAQDGVEKVPGLGDIPVLGNLFKYRTRGRQKTNLMVFLRPTVIRSNEQSVDVASDRYNYIRNAQIIAQPEETMVLPNLGASVLPPLENGKLVGSGMLNLIPAGHHGTSQPSDMLQQQMPPAPGTPPSPQPLPQ